MDASKQIFINCTLEEESDKLDALIGEIHAQLSAWRICSWSSQELSADAVVALLELRHNAEVRMAYLKGWNEQESLPF